MLTKLREAITVTRDLGTAKVIMPVHFAGVACDLQALWDVAREFDLAVVEDAAHAFPSSYEGRPVGWMPADIRGTTNFSFYATKTITTGEGGMVTTHDEELSDRMRVMSLHGLSKQAWNRYSGGTWKYDIVAPGFKYNLTDMAAAMGRVQLGSRGPDVQATSRDRRASTTPHSPVSGCSSAPRSRPIGTRRGTSTRFGWPDPTARLTVTVSSRHSRPAESGRACTSSRCTCTATTARPMGAGQRTIPSHWTSTSVPSRCPYTAR